MCEMTESRDEKNELLHQIRVARNEAAMPDTEERLPVKQQPPKATCNECGSTDLRREGNCRLCGRCGHSTCG